MRDAGSERRGRWQAGEEGIYGDDNGDNGNRGGVTGSSAVF